MHPHPLRYSPYPPVGSVGPLPITVPSSNGETRKKQQGKKQTKDSNALNELLQPDYALNPAGPASNAATTFKCPKCDKVYKGKHARSIWRRHLQDKHGIPLSSQPRRTRWDNDATRPKDEDERHERTLESKRRWARKNRAERRSSEEPGSQDQLSDDPNWIDEELPLPVKRSSAKPVAQTPSWTEELEADLSRESEESLTDIRTRGGSAPLRAPDSRPMLRASMSMGGCAEPPARDGQFIGYPVSYFHQPQQQYLQRPTNIPPQSYHPHYAPPIPHAPYHNVYASVPRPAHLDDANYPQPYSPYPPAHVQHQPYMPNDHALHSLPYNIPYNLTPSTSESAISSIPVDLRSLPHSSSLPNLSHARQAPRENISYYAEAPNSQPILSHGNDVSFDYNSELISKGLLPQPYRGGSNSERDRAVHENVPGKDRAKGESKEDAACVLMALKKGCSSPCSPRFPPSTLHIQQRSFYAQQVPPPPLHFATKTRSPGFGRLEIKPTPLIHGVGVGESSFEDDEPFAYPTSSTSRRHLDADTPPSSTTSDSELRSTNAALRLPKRAASESPPLSNLRESPKKSRAGAGQVDTSLFPKYTSLVATPTPGIFRRIGFESSPAFEQLEDERVELEEDEYEEEDDDEREGEDDDDSADAFSPRRGGRVRDESHSPSTKGKGRLLVLERGSSPNWAPPAVASARPSRAAVAAATIASAGAGSIPASTHHLEMPPPHPGSSSSASSFVLSTPAGPSSRDASFNFKSLYSSGLHSSGITNLTARPREDHFYHSLHLSTAPLSARVASNGLITSSPPSNGFLFSSPAHPGISKQLGLTAQPGPGVLRGTAGGETPGKGLFLGRKKDD